MVRVYCDTCVYVDLFEGRKDRFRDLGEFALSFFNKVKDKQYKLVISDWIIEEFKKVSRNPSIIDEFIRDFEEEDLIKVQRDNNDEKKARKLSSSNFTDALHIVLAKKANAIILVTRNIQDFAEFQDLIEITVPESL